jgi:2-oxoglutarate dehydrogenase E1 component
MNQGAWYQIRHHLEACMSSQHKLTYTGRPASAAPATGSYTLHMAQLHQLVEHALGLNEEKVVRLTSGEKHGS